MVHGREAQSPLLVKGPISGVGGHDARLAWLTATGPCAAVRQCRLLQAGSSPQPTRHCTQHAMSHTASVRCPQIHTISRTASVRCPQVHATPNLERRGMDLHSELQLCCTSAVLGTIVPVSSVRGLRNLYIPQGARQRRRMCACVASAFAFHDNCAWAGMSKCSCVGRENACPHESLRELLASRLPECISSIGGPRVLCPCVCRRPAACILTPTHAVGHVTMHLHCIRLRARDVTNARVRDRLAGHATWPLNNKRVAASCAPSCHGTTPGALAVTSKPSSRPTWLKDRSHHEPVSLTYTEHVHQYAGAPHPPQAPTRLTPLQTCTLLPNKSTLQPCAGALLGLQAPRTAPSSACTVAGWRMLSRAWCATATTTSASP